MGLFTLLSKTEVEIAPGQKIIPAEAFSTIKTAEEILKAAQADALEIKKKAAQAALEAKAEAKEEGYQEGLEALNEKLLKLDHLMQTFENDIAKKIMPIALKAAKKILGEELQLGAEKILSIIRQALKPVLEHHKVIIYVNKADLPVVEENKNKLKEHLHQVKIFSIQERDDIEAGGCIIQTEAGIINAQLENQWRALENAFEKMLKE
ncbi:MAG: FliH/SctL family protein [Parachlamydiales bacterium]|jgi:type III secretion protein L